MNVVLTGVLIVCTKRKVFYANGEEGGRWHSAALELLEQAIVRNRKPAVIPTFTNHRSSSQRPLSAVPADPASHS